MIGKVAVFLVLLVLIISMISSAYAHWNEELKANIKVSTGDLNLRFKCYKIIRCCCCKTPSTYHESGRIVDGGKRFIGEFENVYPKWKAILALAIENVGTVPATLNGINVRTHGDQDLISTFQYKICVLGPLSKKLSKTPYWARLSHDYLKFLSDVCRNKVVLDPGEKAIVIIPMGIGETFTNSSSFNMEVTFDFIASW